MRQQGESDGYLRMGPLTRLAASTFLIFYSALLRPCTSVHFGRSATQPLFSNSAMQVSECAILRTSPTCCWTRIGALSRATGRIRGSPFRRISLVKPFTALAYAQRARLRYPARTRPRGRGERLLKRASREAGHRFGDIRFVYAYFPHWLKVSPPSKTSLRDKNLLFWNPPKRISYWYRTSSG